MNLYHSPAETYTWLWGAVQGITNKWNISTGLGTRFPCAQPEKFNCYVYFLLLNIYGQSSLARPTELLDWLQVALFLE